MTSVLPPICVGCTRLGMLFDPDDTDKPARCDAFDTIPWSILLSKVDHRQAVAGDGGLQFDPKAKADADYAARLFR